MKTKFTILLITLFVLVFSVQAVAQNAKPAALIVGSETQGYNSVEYVLVQTNDDIDYKNFGITWNWTDVVNDFVITDGIVNIPIDSINAVAVPDTNYFNLFFDTATYPYGPAKNDLKLHYVEGTTPIPTVDYGNLQSTTTAINIDDGIAPIVDSLFIYSSNIHNEYLGVAGDTVTCYFIADEALAASPSPVAPKITFTIDELKFSQQVVATEDINSSCWYAKLEIPSPGTNLDGKVKVSATFTDIHANNGSLAQTDEGTDSSFVIIKNYDPTTVYVDDDWASQADVPSGQIWFWDAFGTIQDGIDGVAEGTASKAKSYVSVAAGTYNETVTIDKSYLDIQGVQSNTFINPADTTDGTKVVEILADYISFLFFNVRNTGGVNDYGILLGDGTTTASNCYVNLNIVNGTTYGIAVLPGSNNNTFSMDGIGYCDLYGLAIVNAHHNYVYNNSFGNNRDAIVIENAECIGGSIDNGSTNNTIISNQIESCTNDGIYVSASCDSNTITNNTVRQVTANGIHIWRSGNQTITDNKSYTNGTGLRLHGSSNNAVSGNEIYSNTTGVIVDRKWIEGVWYASENNVISGNNISGNTYGMDASDNNDTIVNAENNWWGTANGPTHPDNTFNVTAQGDSVSDYVDYVPWYDTDMTGSSFWPVELTEGAKATGYFSSIQTAIDAAAGDISETVSCKAGTYTENVAVDKSLSLTGADKTTTFIDGNNDGTVVTVSSNSVTMSNFTVQNSGTDSTDVGILLSAVDSCTIQNNNVTTPVTAIGLTYSEYNNISGNGITNAYYGIGLIDADNNTVTQNNLSSITHTGIAIETEEAVGGSASNVSTGNTVTYNTISTCATDGIFVAAQCNANELMYNTISNAASVGLHLWRADSLGIGYNTITSNGTGIRLHGSSYNEIGYNDITSNTTGVVVNRKYVSGWIASADNIINYNNITGNTYGMDASDNNETEVDAQYNWWNSASGPSHAGNTFNVTAQGDSVSDYVDYVPWLDDEYSIGTEFAPVWLSYSSKGNSEHIKPGIVPSSSKASGYFSSIQAAIDTYPGGSGDVYLQDGTFTENFNMNKDNLWLYSYNFDASVVTLIGEQTVSADEVAIYNVAFDPDGAGTALTVDTSVDPIDEYFVIYDCIFTINESPSVGIYLGGGTTPHILTDVRIEDCIFYGPDDKIANPWKIGGAFGDNIGCPIHDMIFTENEVNKCSIPVNLVNENIDGLGITYNDFYDTDGVIYFWNDSGISPTGVLSNFIFENNYVPSSNSYGVAIGGASLGGPIFTDANFGTGNRINDNAFEIAGTAYGYGAVYMADQYTGLLDASNNWWGDEYGPLNDNNTYTPPVNKGRATVSDRVEFAPWWNDGTNACSGRGWEPDASASLYAPVHNVTQDTYHSSIQRGIDGASGGDSLSCLPGTFTENVTVDEAVVIAGQDSSSTFINGNGSGIVVTVTHNDVTLSDFTVTNSGSNPTTDAGIMLYGISGCTLQRLIVKDNDAAGIALQLANENVIQYNRLSNNYIAGIALVASSDNTIIHNYSGYNKNIVKDNYGYGVVLTENDENTSFSIGNTISYNTLVYNDYNGIYCGQRCDTNTVQYNTVTNNGSDGIYLWKSGTNTISNNTVTNNTATGIQLMASQNNTITYNTVTDNNEGFLVRSGNINYGTTASPSWVEVHSTGNAIHYNHITENTTDGMTNEDDTFDVNAEKNWWGDKYGPQHASNPWNGTTTGSVVSDSVDFTPWWATSTVTDTTEWVTTRMAYVKGYAIPSLAVADSIQVGIDVAINDYKYVQVGDKGSDFVEDLSVPASAPDSIEIFGGALDKASYPTLKGIAHVEASQWPLASANIDIWNVGTELYNFIIEAPDYVEGYYSSGICVGAAGVNIHDNYIILNVVNTSDDISQAIQTYRDVDCSTLTITNNTFTDGLLVKGSWGYEGIYINPNSGETSITDNTFEGMCLRAITIEDAGSSVIYNNSIQTTLSPLVDWDTSGAYQGINLQGDLSSITIKNNYIGGTYASCGFAQGIRLGSEGDTFTNVVIGGTDSTYANRISGNSYGILCKSAGGVAVNYNIIKDNAFGVQNDDVTVKSTLDATYNYWGAADGPSWAFDYGIGSGSGDSVSTYVDFYPWYQDIGLTTLYASTISQYLLSLNPVSPYVDNYFDLRVCAADSNGIRDFSYNSLVDFSGSHAALTVPEEQLLDDGFKEISNACISSLPFDASDDLTIYAWEYNTNPPSYYSDLTDIVIRDMNNPAAPDSVVFSDVPGDNGGWIEVSYILSIDDPFYTAVKDTSYGVSYYVIEIDTVGGAKTSQWQFLSTIACYDNGSGTNNYTALIAAPASDKEFNFRMSAVYNPAKLSGFNEDHISYKKIELKDAGAQSEWQYGSAAPKDNLPAYANMKVFLEGPYSGGVMTDGAQKPLVSPYDGLTLTELPLPNDQIVDWVYVELRLAATGETVKQANAFLLTNGTLVDVNGNNSLPFFYTTDVGYYMVIHHRNHLDVMSSTTHTFGDFASQATTIDLTTSGSAYNNGFKEVEAGVYAMYDGDANGSELVNVNDAYELIDNFGASGYLGSDLNLSGYVNVNDAYELIGNFGVGSSVPDNTSKGEKQGNDDDIEFNIPSSTGTKVLECTLEIKNVQVVSGVSYSFDIYITRNTSDWSTLGHLTFITETWYSDLVLNFNGSALANPVVSGLSPLATSTTVTTPSTGELSINLIDGGTTVPTTETKLLTVTFDITDASATAMLTWDSEDTAIINEASGQYITSNGTLSLVGSDDSTLPVELSTFAALYSTANDNVELKWNTATETDVNGFNIYRSESKDLTRAGRNINYSLIPATGTTTEPQSYTYSDVVADVYTTHYYWLEVVDLGGTSTFHGPITYTPGDTDGDNQPDMIESTELVGNWPNPAVNSTKIHYQIKGYATNQDATISVYNIRGGLVKTIQGKNGVASLDTSDMGHGIYFYRLQTDDYTDIKKLIVVK